MKICGKGTDGKNKSCQLHQEVNPNAHQHTMRPGRSQLAAHSIPSTPTPMRAVVVIDSDTESESESQSANDGEEYSEIIKNQAGMPGFQYGIVKSNPSLANTDVDSNVSNNESEFSSRKGLRKLNSRIAEAACRAQVSADEGNTFGMTNTDVVLSVGDKMQKASLS